MAGAFSVEPLLPPEDVVLFDPFRPEERAPAPSAPRPRLRLPPRSGRARAPSSVLPSAPALFPWLARSLAPGEATLWCGPRLAVEPILEMLYAGSALARGRVSLLEGANRFHPYRIGELGRALGLGAEETLDRIRLARAFTAHQMVALVDGWAREARRHPPTLLVGHDLPTLFWDGETPDDERDALLRHVARTLGRLLDEIRVPLLLTLGPDGPARFVGLSDAGPRWADLVRFERGPTTLRARALRSDARLALVPRGTGQRGIEEFGDAPSAEEVIGWDVPCRRTARRSRSG
jgi:hypothetical protein